MFEAEKFIFKVGHKCNLICRNVVVYLKSLPVLQVWQINMKLLLLWSHYCYYEIIILAMSSCEHNNFLLKQLVVLRSPVHLFMYILTIRAIYLHAGTTPVLYTLLYFVAVDASLHSQYPSACFLALYHYILICSSGLSYYYYHYYYSCY